MLAWCKANCVCQAVRFVSGRWSNPAGNERFLRHRMLANFGEGLRYRSMDSRQIAESIGLLRLPHQLSRIGIDSTDPVASASAAAADNALL
jgi:hypothetical protein